MVTKLGAWLRPVLLGPWLLIVAGITIAVFLFGQWDPLLGGPISNWLIALILGAIWSTFLSAMLIGVDVARAAVGTALPQGLPAWIGAAVATSIAYALYHFFPPGAHDTIWGFVWAAIWPNAVAAIVSRFVTWRP